MTHLWIVPTFGAVFGAIGVRYARFRKVSLPSEALRFGAIGGAVPGAIYLLGANLEFRDALFERGNWESFMFAVMQCAVVGALVGIAVGPFAARFVGWCVQSLTTYLRPLLVDLAECRRLRKIELEERRMAVRAASRAKRSAAVARFDAEHALAPSESKKCVCPFRRLRRQRDRATVSAA